MSVCLGSHRQNPLCHLADGLWARGKFLVTKVAVGRESDCLTTEAREPKGHRWHGSEDLDREDRLSGATVLEKCTCQNGGNISDVGWGPVYGKKAHSRVTVSVSGFRVPNLEQNWRLEQIIEP